MSQNQNQAVVRYIGRDVAKASLQFDLPGLANPISNEAKGHARRLKLLRDHPTAHIVCEATGGYEQAIVRVLQTARVPVSIVEAGRVRHFARAKGQRAKSDPSPPRC